MRIPVSLRVLILWQKVVFTIVDLVPRHEECRYCHKHIRGVFARHRLGKHKLDEHFLEAVICEVILPSAIWLSMVKTVEHMSKVTEVD